MAVIPLPAATVSIASALNANTALPASEPTSLTGGSGISFPNNGAVLLRVVIGASGATVLNFFNQKLIEGALGNTVLFTTPSLGNNGIFLFGPFPPSVYNDVNGLVQMTMVTYTGNSAGIYNLPAARV